MTNSEHLQTRFPALGRKLKKVQLTTLPTPVREVQYRRHQKAQVVWIKEDNLTGKPYGGNKVRKLEYLLQPALDKRRSRIATFGAVGSHHALATALYARRLGLGCTAFLSHQARALSIPATLNTHLRIGTEIVRYGGAYCDRIKTLRRHLGSRNAWVIAAGGSSWLGAVGFIDAALELAEQIDAQQLPMPERIYVATGTMSTVAGLAIGLAIAELPTEIHAVRVSHIGIANIARLERLIKKTALMLNRLDPSFPADISERARVILRNEYFGSGYAHSDATTDAAIATAIDQFDLKLESTYTGKAMAAMLDDLDTADDAGGRFLFWNTYHSAPLEQSAEQPPDSSKLPAEFLRYFNESIRRK